jgi:hypothetical protein
MAEREEQVLANPDTAYEREDMKLMAVGVLALVTFVFLLLIPLILRGAYPGTLADVNRQLEVSPPAPTLQTDPARDLQEFRSREDARLDSYGWVDREKGVVHVPIGQAMKETAAKGIADFPKGAP